MSRRTERLGSAIRHEVATMIQQELRDPRVPAITSVTRVKVAEDLSTADVYVTMMGTPGEQTAGLNALRHSAGLMRARLTKALSVRQVPYLKFHLDENLKKELAVLDLLQKVAEENAQADRQRAGAGEQQGTPEDELDGEVSDGDAEPDADRPPSPNPG